MTSEAAAGELAGKAALLSGASGGIGGAIARGLAAAGVRLVVSGRDRGRLEALAAELRAASPRVEVAVADLADDEELRRLAEQAVAALGGVDVLVHSAGAFGAGPVATAPVADLDRQLRLNLRAPYLLTQLLLPSLRQRRGQVVFINSTAGLAARGATAAYAASKHALKALADGLREEVNPEVRVLSVFPGRTASAMQEAVRRFEGRPYDPGRYLQPADVAATVLAALALPRTAEVTELTVRQLQP